MGLLKPWHIIVLLLVILLLFGGKKLPDLARSIGKSLHILKDEAKSLAGDDAKDSGADETGAVAEPAEPVKPADEARDK